MNAAQIKKHYTITEEKQKWFLSEYNRNETKIFSEIANNGLIDDHSNYLLALFVLDAANDKESASDALEEALINLGIHFNITHDALEICRAEVEIFFENTLNLI